MINATRTTHTFSYTNDDENDEGSFVERDAPGRKVINAESITDCQEFLILRQPGQVETVADLKK